LRVSELVLEPAAEILPPLREFLASFPVTARPNLFKPRKCFALPVGCTLLDAVEQAGIPMADWGETRVYLANDRIPPDRWNKVRPRSSVPVAIVVVPRGGGGGSKNTLRLVAMIALIAVASIVTFGVGAALTGAVIAGVTLSAGAAAAIGAAAGAVVMAAGTMALNYFIPPPMPKAEKLGNRADKTTYTLEGARNDVRLYGVVPTLIGRHRVFPPFAAKPYAELVGDKTYLRGLVTWGYGEIALEPGSLRIGDTLASAYRELEHEFLTGAEVLPVSRLFPRVAFEAQESVVFSQGMTVTRTSPADVFELHLIFGFPQGLYKVSSNTGDMEESEVNIEVDVAPAGSGLFTRAAELELESKKTTPFRRGLRVRLPGDGRWDARLRCTRMPTGSVFDHFNQCVLQDIRWMSHDQPVRLPGLSLSGFRVLATDQLNGVIDTLNGIGTRVALDWNGSAWTKRATRNNAAMYRWILEGPANPNPITLDEIDLPAIQDWSEFCAGQGFTADGVFDSDTSVWDALSTICAAGRAAPAYVDGRFTVVWDRPQSLPRQLLTPRNTRSFSARRVFPEEVHGFRVRFVNETKEYEQDERVVYGDGYDANNADKLETREFPFVVNPDLIYKHARYHLAVRRLRPETYTVEQDIEGLVLLRGDLALLAHDVPRLGSGFGRIRELLVNDAGLVAGLRLDETITVPAGAVVRVRYGDGTPELYPLSNEAGDNNRLWLTTPLALEDAPELGDLCAVGELTRETRQVLVQGVEGMQDLGVRLALVDYAPGCFVADSEPIPAFESGITTPTGAAVIRPEPPPLEEVITDERVLEIAADGTLRPRFFVRLAVPGPFGGRAELQLRETAPVAAEDWGPAASFPAESPDLAVAAEEGRTYLARVRWISAFGRPGDWSETEPTYVIGKQSPPPGVTGLAVVLQPDGARASWQPVAARDLRDYRVELDGLPLSRQRVTDYFIGPLAAGQHQLAVWAVDTGERVSISPALAGFTVVPPAAPRASVQVVDQFVQLSYPTAPGSFLIRSYEVRRGPYLETATLIANTSGPFFPAFEPSSGAFDYWIIARDLAKNQSIAARVTATVAPSTNFELLHTHDSDFTSGTGINVKARDGELIMATPSGETWGSHFADRGWLTVRDQLTAGYPIFGQPAAATASWQEVIDFGAVLNGVLIGAELVTRSGAGTVLASPMLEGSTDGAAWALLAVGWTAAAAEIRYLRITIDFSSADLLGILRADLRVVLNVRRIVDSGTADVAAGDAGGTSIGFNVQFIDVESVTVSALSDQPLHATQTFEDVAYPTDFQAFLWDAGGTRASGRVAWTARGRG
jgi:hypothetical protein